MKKEKAVRKSHVAFIAPDQINCPYRISISRLIPPEISESDVTDSWIHVGISCFPASFPSFFFPSQDLWNFSRDLLYDTCQILILSNPNKVSLSSPLASFL